MPVMWTWRRDPRASWLARVAKLAMSNRLKGEVLPQTARQGASNKDMWYQPLPSTGTHTCTFTHMSMLTYMWTHVYTCTHRTYNYTNNISKNNLIKTITRYFYFFSSYTLFFGSCRTMALIMLLCFSKPWNQVRDAAEEGQARDMEDSVMCVLNQSALLEQAQP